MKKTTRCLSTGWWIALLAMVATSLHAQTINWTSGYPKMNQVPLVMLESERTLQVRFTPLTADVANAAIEVKLPANVDFISASTPSAGITFTSTASGALATGKTVMLTVTSNGNKLLRNTEVEFHLNVGAVSCGTPGAANFDIAVKSGAATVTGGTKTVAVNINKPSPAIVSTDGTVSYTSQTEVKTITYYLKTNTADSASSARVTFTVNQHTTLADFKLNGAPLTATPGTVGTNKTYTIDFTPAVLGGAKIDQTNNRKIEFKASSTGCGSQTIASSVQYPYNSNCATAGGSTVTMAFPAFAPPTMTHVNTRYIDASNATVATHLIAMDGVTPTVVETSFRNDGGSTAQEIVLDFRNYAFYNYLKIDDIYVQVQGGTRRKVLAAEITTHGTLGNASNIGYRKPTTLGKPTRIYIKVPETVPPGSTITYWVPTVNGDVNDNGTHNVVHNYYTNVINGISSNITSVKGSCGDNGTAAVASHRILYLNAPHYREVPANLNIKGGQTKTQTIFVAPGHVGYAPAEFGVKIPASLPLSVRHMKLTTDIDGNNVVVQTTFGAGTKEGLLVVTGTGNINRGTDYLHITYEADACGGSTIDKTAVIKHFVNQRWNTHTIDSISQVRHTANVMCNLEGIQFEKFELERTTKGLKDSNNDRVPDDGSPAPKNEINNNLYVDGDRGIIRWEGTVLPGGSYQHLYATIKSYGVRLSNQVVPGSATIKKNGAVIAGNVAFVRINDTEGYYHVATPLSAGDQIIIEAPFAVQSGTNEPNSLEAELFVSATAIPGVRFGINNAARKGIAKMTSPIATFKIDRLNHWYHDGLNHTFTDNAVITAGSAPLHSTGYTDILHDGRLIAPYFPKEVRYLEYLKQLTFELPRGYRLTDMKLTTRATHSAPFPTLPYAFINAPIVEAAGSTLLKRIYNVEALYDLTFTGAGSVAAGKHQLPDDFWRIFSYGKLQALPSAKRGASKMVRTSVWKNPATGQETTQSKDIIFNYTGPGNSLAVSMDSVTAYGAVLKQPTLTIGNQTSSPIQDMYFYFEGPIKDVKLKNGATTHTGTGIDNRWVKVANVAGNATVAFDMEYTYNFPTSCNRPDTVKVYTAAGFNHPWSAPTGGPLDLDGANFSAADTFLIGIAPAAITGSITAVTAKPDTLPESSINNYTIKANFSSATSPGALRNPEMSFTVPIGQVYVPGSAQVEYPVGTFTNVSPAFEAALAAAFGGGETAARTTTLPLADAMGVTDALLPGGPGVPANEQVASIIMKFEAKCNSNYAGLQYSGRISGSSICNAPAAGNNTAIVSRMLYPDVVYNYLFEDITVNTTSGSKAFNEIQREDTLILTLKKITGSVNAMAATDSLEIKLPKELNLAGDSVAFEGSGTMAALNGRKDEVTSNIVASNVRTIRIPMPITEYNAALNKGVGAEIKCRIPVKYTPNGQTRATTPKDSIVAAVNIFALFGNCPPIVVPIGKAKDSIALVSSDSIPYIVYLTETANLHITSSGFNGQWYRDKAGLTPPFHTGHTYSFTPTDSSKLGDQMLYFSAIVDGHNYGMLPFPVKIWIHPWFIRNLPPVTHVCTDRDTLRVKAGGMDVKYQWYRDSVGLIPGATDTVLPVTEAGFYHVLVTDSVGEVISSDTTEVYFNIIPRFTKDLPKTIRECDRWGYLLDVETTGRYLRYQWYRDGRPIKGATQKSYYALSSDSSAFFRVVVKTHCGDSVSSRQTYLSFCDEPINWRIKRSVLLVLPGTVESNLQPGTHTVESLRDFIFTVKVKPGYTADWMSITTDNAIWTEAGGGIERQMLSDSVMQVRILMVNRNLTVTIGDIYPLKSDRIAGDDDTAPRAWGSRSRIYTHSPQSATVDVYTVTGQLYRRERIEGGETTSFEAAAGFYIVRFGNGHTTKVFVE